VPEVCQWEYDQDDDAYQTGCGEMWHFITGTAEENGVKFCPCCGKPLPRTKGDNEMTDKPEYPKCLGKNCGTTCGNHSPECLAEHAEIVGKPEMTDKNAMRQEFEMIIDGFHSNFERNEFGNYCDPILEAKWEGYQICAGWKLRDEIAGLQAFAAKKDESLRNLHEVCQIALEGKDGTQHAYFETRRHTSVSAVEVMEGAEQAIALTSPSAALEAVIKERVAIAKEEVCAVYAADKIKLLEENERLSSKLARYENMEPVAELRPTAHGYLFVDNNCPLSNSVVPLFTHPKE
jgi:hypothetical protein